MGPWQLELLRLWRTRRLIVLAATFLALGLGLPVLTYYLPQLVKHAANGITIIAPKQTPADAIQGFASNTGQLGTLVVVIIAAASFSIDAHPILAAFYRTRLRRPSQLLLPRYLTVAIAATVMLALGTLAAWYETVVLLGSVPVLKLLAGFAHEALWIWFATSLVAAFSSLLRNPAAIAGAAIATLLAIALLGDIAALSSWLPTRLAQGVSALVAPNKADDIWRPVLIATATSIALMTGAIRRLGTREI